MGRSARCRRRQPSCPPSVFLRYDWAQLPYLFQTPCRRPANSHAANSAGRHNCRRKSNKHSPRTVPARSSADALRLGEPPGNWSSRRTTTKVQVYPLPENSRPPVRAAHPRESRIAESRHASPCILHQDTRSTATRYPPSAIESRATTSTKISFPCTPRAKAPTGTTNTPVLFQPGDTDHKKILSSGGHRHLATTHAPKCNAKNHMPPDSAARQETDQIHMSYRTTANPHSIHIPAAHLP